MKQQYFSDDELNSFLEDLEENDMHTAPFYLKEEIMKQAFPEQVITQIPLEKRKLSREQKRKWIIYNCKITLAAAAAILLMFLMPTENSSVMSGEEVGAMTQVTNSIEHGSERLCNMLSNLSDRMIVGNREFQNKESEE